MELLLGAIIAVLSFFLGAVFSPYLTGYATKKGEKLATHDDIDKLVDQVKAVTEATKKIEAEISSCSKRREKYPIAFSESKVFHCRWYQSTDQFALWTKLFWQTV